MIIERHLTHGDWHNGQRTPALEPVGMVAHAMGYQIKIDRSVLEYYGTDVGDLGEIVYAATWLDRIGYSAHILVAPAGEAIRCRHDNELAWHCKANGRNWTHLGVEWLVPDVTNYAEFLEAIREDWLSTEQYNTGVEIASEWARTYGWARDAFTRHSDEDDAKHDPGDGFPWGDFVSDVMTRAAA